MCEGIEGRLGKKLFCSSQKMLMILLLQNIFTLLLCRERNLVKGQIFLGRLGFAPGHLRSAEWLLVQLEGRSFAKDVLGH